MLTDGVFLDTLLYCCLPACLQAVLDSGISSIAVVLKHAAIYPDHEQRVGQLAQQMGFKQVTPDQPPSTAVKVSTLSTLAWYPGMLPRWCRRLPLVASLRQLVVEVVLLAAACG